MTTSSAMPWKEVRRAGDSSRSWPFTTVWFRAELVALGKSASLVGRTDVLVVKQEAFNRGCERSLKALVQYVEKLSFQAGRTEVALMKQGDRDKYT